MAEINLMRNYPKSPRNLNARETSKTPEHQRVAREFGKEFFDGERSTGYGGFSYDPKFWTPVIPDMVEHFQMENDSSLLDVGCAKGFMLADFKALMPKMTLHGIDISDYAIKNSHPSVSDFVSVGDCRDLPFENNSIDYVISITTIHNLDYDDCITALSEVQRVAKKGAFVTLDAYSDDDEKKAMLAWNLTAKTILHKDEWVDLFKKAGYLGDYYWFLP